jgi:hypothetical protein
VGWGGGSMLTHFVGNKKQKHAQINNKNVQMYEKLVAIQKLVNTIIKKPVRFKIHNKTLRNIRVATKCEAFHRDGQIYINV